MIDDLENKVNGLEDQKGSGIYLTVPISDKQVYVISSVDIYNWVVARWTGEIDNLSEKELFGSGNVKGASRYLLGYFRDLKQAIVALNEHNIRSKKLIRTLDEYIAVEKESQEHIAKALDLKMADL